MSAGSRSVVNHSHCTISSGSITAGTPEYSVVIKPNVTKCASGTMSFVTLISRNESGATTNPVSSRTSRHTALSKVSPKCSFPPGNVQVPSPCRRLEAFSGSECLLPSNTLCSLRIITPKPTPILRFSISVPLFDITSSAGVLGYPTRAGKSRRQFSPREVPAISRECLGRGLSRPTPGRANAASARSAVSTGRDPRSPASTAPRSEVSPQESSPPPTPPPESKTQAVKASAPRHRCHRLSIKAAGYGTYGIAGGKQTTSFNPSRSFSAASRGRPPGRARTPHRNLAAPAGWRRGLWGRDASSSAWARRMDRHPSPRGLLAPPAPPAPARSRSSSRSQARDPSPTRRCADLSH